MLTGEAADEATRTLLNEIDLVVYDMAGTTVQATVS